MEAADFLVVAASNRYGFLIKRFSTYFLLNDCSNREYHIEVSPFGSIRNSSLSKGNFMEPLLVLIPWVQVWQYDSNSRNLSGGVLIGAVVNTLVAVANA